MTIKEIVSNPEVTFESFKADVGRSFDQLKIGMILSNSDQYTLEDLLNIAYLIGRKESNNPTPIFNPTPK